MGRVDAGSDPDFVARPCGSRNASAQLVPPFAPVAPAFTKRTPVHAGVTAARVNTHANDAKQNIYSLFYFVSSCPPHVDMRSERNMYRKRETESRLSPHLDTRGGNNGRLLGGEGDDRDHNPYGFTMYMVGGGVQGGQIIGATDEVRHACG